MKTITQFLLGFGVLFTSFSVICLGDNPVLAVVFLIATFVLAAIYLILMGINFIGITYIILYVGAIAVLFLFVIMMLNLKDKDLIEPSSVTLNNGIYSFIIVILFAYLINYLTSFSLNFKNLGVDYFSRFNSAFDKVDLLKDWSYLKTLDQLNNITINKGKELSQADTSLLDLTQIETLSHDLYTYGAVLLISLSIVLLLAMFATIIISKPNAVYPSSH